MEFENIKLSTQLLQTISAEQAWQYSIVPKTANSNSIEFYIDKEKANDFTRDELEVIFGKQIIFNEITPESINKILGKYYRKSRKKSKTVKSLSVDINSEDFINDLIEEANSINSSDIHIESYEDICRVRMRIDGKLIERYIIPKEEYPAIINKIKIKSHLDIAEKRLPQDGRIYFENGDEKFDLRISVLPTLYGEKIVMRLLSKDSTNIDINQLGFQADQLEYYMEGVKKPHGIILISGPTGSGKTTTLYATLKILNNEYSNILTIEDPIEYTLEGINQVQLKESIGLTFASALRSFLRQDPDIIMLGEIRDSETAQMAIRAALTGHLVLSTIHTNSAWGTISRLIDMGVPPFLLASTLNLSVAQRLVRLLCPNCKVEEAFDKTLYPKNFKPKTEVKKHYVAKGCEDCYYTGYKGRKAIFEVIPVDFELAEKIKHSDLNINEFINLKNIKLMVNTAFDLFIKGETTIEEIYSILIESNLS
ncbi:MAG: type II/IV secretion system protein [Bacteroidales bacterium]|nr:type II/IV secretion system protein [Bacteroidales bacterium]